MNTINVENCKTLLIGRRGENEVTTVAFDFTEWATEFGSGVVDLYVKRFGDDSAYPVVLTIDGTVASWLVTETDTNVAGYGKAEYVYRVDGKIAKSAVFPFFVAEDIGQPASEPPDPYESWLEQLTALGAETEANAQAAEQSAENAAESAQEAAGSATSAEGYAGQAETAAGLAQAAQTASEAAMDAAQTAQASAESSATAASGSATSAAGSATSAAGSASDASESASAASDSATAASASATTASNAATAAQTAQSAAEDAAEDAQQAAQQAHVEYEQLSGEVDDLSDEVSQQKSAIDDLTALTNRKAGMLVDTASGAIASFAPDATVPALLDVSVDIEPQQDLHGYDNPWPAGGGKNLFDPSLFVEQAGWYIIELTLLPNTAYTMSTNLTQAKTNELPVYFKNENVGGGSSTTAVYDTHPVTRTSDENGHLYISERRVSGTDIFANYQWQVEAGTTPTSYAPFENLCPISGWDSVEVERASDNLLSFDGREVYQSNFTPTTPVDFSRPYVFTGYASTGYRFNNQVPDDIAYAEDNSVSFTAKSAWYGIGWNVKISPGMTYTKACDNLVGGLHIAFYDKAGLYISRVTGASTFISPANAQYAIICLCNSTSGATSAQRVRLSFGTSDKGWVQPVSTTYTIQLGQTVYGATLDVTNGTMTVDRAMVDLGTLTWYYSTQGTPKFYLSSNLPNQTNVAADLIFSCSAYKNGVQAGITSANLADYSVFADWNKRNGILVTDSRYTDVTSFRNAVSGVQLVYRLATPIEIQLDPVTISTISGQTNNVWADAGDVSVTYAADIKAYIDRMNQPTEDDMIANSLIASGKYFTVNNRLFLSTASIAAGAQIIPGHNCTETNLAAALNALNA